MGLLAIDAEQNLHSSCCFRLLSSHTDILFRSLQACQWPLEVRVLHFKCNEYSHMQVLAQLIKHIPFAEFTFLCCFSFIVKSKPQLDSVQGCLFNVPLPGNHRWFFFSPQVAAVMGKALLEFVWTLRFHTDA